MSLFLQNNSGGPLPVNDLGITLATGATFDLTLVSDPQIVVISANGGDLDALVTAGSLTVLDPIGGWTLSVADGLSALREHNDTHWRLGSGSRLPDLSDVDDTGLVDGQVLYWNQGNGSFEFATPQDIGGGFLGLGEWEYESGITPPPSDKKFKFNNAAPASATKLYIDYNNDEGDDLTNFLSNIGNGSVIYAQDREDATKGFVANVTAYTDGGTYAEYDVTDVTLLGTALPTGDKYVIFATGTGGGGVTELDDLTDVTITGTPTEGSQLVYDDGTNQWVNQAPADATAFGQMFEVVFSEESSVSDAWIASNGTPSNEAPPVVGWDCRLAGITFTNKEVNADTVLQIWRVAEGAAPGTATLVESWTITNARTARKTDYGLTEVTFSEGDKIAIYFVQAGDTDPSGVTVICHFIITDFTGAEVVDNWAGNI